MACWGCLACVEQSTVGMVEKWDRFSYVAQPGLHCLNPFLGEWMAGRLSLRVQSLDVRCDTKTKVCNQKLLLDFFIAYDGYFATVKISFGSSSLGLGKSWQIRFLDCRSLELGFVVSLSNFPC
jgi:hypothetical protein